MKWNSVFAVVAILVSGCASIRTTPVTRQSDDSYCVQCPANGVPVTVKVPTHLKVNIYEQLFFKYENDSGQESIVLLNKDDGHRNLKVESTPVKTEKVIFVDAKRPAAGTMAYNMEFDSNAQMITQYESFAFDRTLEDSANLMAQLIPEANKQSNLSTADFTQDTNFANKVSPNRLFKEKSTVFDQRKVKDFSSTNPAKFEDDIFTRKRVVAFKIFDINASDFEQRLQAFLSLHLNQCHDCETNPFRIPDQNESQIQASFQPLQN